MNLTYQSIIRIYETLESFKDSKPIDINTTFKIVRNIRALSPEVESIQAARDEIIKKYSIETADGEYKVPESMLAQANQDFQIVLSNEIKVFILPLKLAELEGLNLSIEQLNNLFEIITED